MLKTQDLKIDFKVFRSNEMENIQVSCLLELIYPIGALQPKLKSRWVQKYVHNLSVLNYSQAIN